MEKGRGDETGEKQTRNRPDGNTVLGAGVYQIAARSNPLRQGRRQGDHDKGRQQRELHLGEACPGSRAHECIGCVSNLCGFCNFYGFQSFYGFCRQPGEERNALRSRHNGRGTKATLQIFPPLCDAPLKAGTLSIHVRETPVLRLGVGTLHARGCKEEPVGRGGSRRRLMRYRVVKFAIRRWWACSMVKRFVQLLCGEPFLQNSEGAYVRVPRVSTTLSLRQLRWGD